MRVEERINDNESSNSKYSFINEKIQQNLLLSKQYLTYYNYFLYLASFLHLIVAGMAIGYIIIIASTKNFPTWFRLFSYISMPADIFFYVSSFFIFIMIILYLYILQQVERTRTITFFLFILSFIFMMINLFFNTYCLPMSIYLGRIRSDYSNWFDLLNDTSTAYSTYFILYKTYTIIRMSLIIITSLFIDISIIRSSSSIFQELFNKI